MRTPAFVKDCPGVPEIAENFLIMPRITQECLFGRFESQESDVFEKPNILLCYALCTRKLRNMTINCPIQPEFPLSDTEHKNVDIDWIALKHVLPDTQS